MASQDIESGASKLRLLHVYIQYSNQIVKSPPADLKTFTHVGEIRSMHGHLLYIWYNLRQTQARRCYHSDRHFTIPLVWSGCRRWLYVVAGLEHGSGPIGWCGRPDVPISDQRAVTGTLTTYLSTFLFLNDHR